MFRSPKAYDGLRVHMIGIGGCGMSGAATMLLELGAVVSGSDLNDFPGLGDLVNRGARVTVGHDAAHLRPDTDLVVISAAIPDANPELRAARAIDKPVIKYAELLGALMQTRRGVGIAGTHGKTTTTAMSAVIFREAGLRPSFVFGAESTQLGGHSAVDDGEHFIVESCEFDRSFLHLHPHAAAILNIEADHLDCFGSLDELVASFSRFASQVDPHGLVVCSGNDSWARRAASASQAPVQTVGFDPDDDWQAVNLIEQRGCFSFDVQFQGAHVLSTRLAIPGVYNVSNALAAIALARHCGADADAVARGVAAYQGVHRRMSVRGFGNGVTVIDDYAHHPTEVRVTLRAARTRFEPKRTLVVFQPHQYARTCRLMDEFAGAFSDADEVIVPDIFTAREPGARAAEGAAELASKICDRGGRATYLPSLEDATKHVLDRMRAGDLVVTMGAGDVWKVADELVGRICGSDRTGCSPFAHDVVSPGRNGTLPVPAA